jgi:hypothetical protein
VDGIVTQGRKDAAQWLTLYDIYTSNDQSSWSRVSSGENSQGQFPGNIDNVYNQFSVFSPPVKAQYVKVVPLSWNGHLCMRWSVLIGSGDEVRAPLPPLAPLKHHTAAWLPNISLAASREFRMHNGRHWQQLEWQQKGASLPC